MVDVSGKGTTVREALAEGFVVLTKAIVQAIGERSTEKGDVLKIAELAGIMAAKRTPEIIPLCHSIRLNSVSVECKLDEENAVVKIRALARASEVTGVEMEALTAVSAAALTVYDMCKGIDKGMRIDGIQLLRKSGGESDDYAASNAPFHAGELRNIHAAVLTVSDKGARGERKDTAGPALCGLLKSAGAEIVHSAVVPDEREAIAEIVREWAKDSHLILTTGGTGISQRDTTPEALLEIADRSVPGLAELMRAESQKCTPNAPLSRSLAVTRGQCLIVALPGSERGARQCFEVILQALPHAVGILNGWDAECGG